MLLMKLGSTLKERLSDGLSSVGTCCVHAFIVTVTRNDMYMHIVYAT